MAVTDEFLWHRRRGNCPVLSNAFGPSSSTMALIWNADPNGSVTEYRIEMGSGAGLADRYSVLTGSLDTVYQLSMLTGIYYFRVRSMIGGTPDSASPDIVLVVT